MIALTTYGGDEDIDAHWRRESRRTLRRTCCMTSC